MKVQNNMIKERGITIIALIITIMVLFILAGVATSKMSEMEGLIDKSKDTVEFIESANCSENNKKEQMNSAAISYIIK